ncbi:MAG TPA: sterol desaturase family protein [Acidimicrobiales bacterium]|nr:sterol desaturase family protein [Acidimicrobiales bacterium]
MRITQDFEVALMADTMRKPENGYQPSVPIRKPPLYAWPPRPLKAIRWLLFGLYFPWGFLFIGLGIVSWNFLTPSSETMATLNLWWMGVIWLRNALLLSALAGALHWWLYIRRGQGQDFKFTERWLATSSRKFLWKNQVRDNIFWCLASGVTFWSLFESLTLWAWASNRIPSVTWSESPIYLGLMISVGVIFWSTLHFWIVHRALHWKPLYQLAHDRHHRNVNIGPWSGISFHPIEHIIYFTVFLIWWVVPVHPIVIIVSGFYNGLSPAFSHSGFDYIVVGNKWKLSTGDLYHQLHHRYFEVNYGNTPTPLDAVFGTWHDGTQEAQERLRHRRRSSQKD